MADYDFHQLSPHDFENMARDLLQADWGLILESFKTGKDGGIDFRYAKAGSRIVVQCKHYVRTGLAGLLRDLKEEAAKVHKLKPQRYVLVTSVPLSPTNKDAIVKIIGADVLTTSDILGQDDLNNRLGQHPAVEGSHYKLWLASRAVLDRVMHNSVITQSEFKVRAVYKEIPRYVQTDAFPSALEILNRDRIVIIAGTPGVGKTTLANLLLYEHLEKGYQAVVIQRDIQEGQALFQEGEPQIFYYDDFLGTTFLGDRGLTLNHNEDRVLVDFIAMVRSSPNARLVLTTREHILSQSLEKSERMRHSDIGDHKLILHISDYTFGQRAEILYNHLYFSELPAEYQDELLREEFYFQIIKHYKYNPRLIEWLSTYRRLRNVAVADYRNFVLRLLEDSSEIWRHAYENEISDAGRTLLLALFTLNGRTSVSILEKAFSALHAVRVERYGFQRRPDDFKVAFRELTGAFIKLTSTNVIEVLDPSVLDLLNSVIRDTTDNAIDLICGSARFDQIERVWSFANSAQGQSVMSALSQNVELISASIEPRLYDPRKVSVNKVSVTYVGTTFERRLAVLIELADHFQHPILLQHIEKLFSRLNEEWQTESVNISDGIEILISFNRIRWGALDTIPNILIGCRDAIIAEVEKGCSSSDLRELISALPSDEIEESYVLAALQNGLEEYRQEYFREELRECRSSSQFDGLLDDLQEFQSVLHIDTSHEIERTLEAKAEFEDHEAAYADHMQDQWKEDYYENRANEASIREMFGSLTTDRKH
ncbi:MAG: restriction endonuclease [Gallionella sp.]|nr:restriction endonuclease [Gallionella sp.]